VKIRLVAEGNKIQNESNFYYLENLTIRKANKNTHFCVKLIKILKKVFSMVTY